jgi:hypothetical protein
MNVAHPAHSFFRKHKNTQQLILKEHLREVKRVHELYD